METACQLMTLETIPEEGPFPDEARSKGSSSSSSRSIESNGDHQAALCQLPLDGRRSSCRSMMALRGKRKNRRQSGPILRDLSFTLFFLAFILSWCFGAWLLG